MKIHLKQREIEAALRGYIAKQGISLQGRTLEIDFTSGRSGNGLTADISIEEIEIPGFEGSAQEDPVSDTGADSDESGDQDEAVKPSKSAGKPVLKAVQVEHPAGVQEEEAPVANPFVDPVDPAPPVGDPPSTVKTGHSLFN